MFLFKFWSFIMGYVTLIVEGQGMERFVNMAISRGIYLWDISRVGENRMLVKARVSGFRALRHICRRAGCCMKIRQKIGLPFVLLQIKKRKMMVAGAVIFICSLYVLSSVIWIVEVKGVNNIPREQVLKLARAQGIKPGTLKWGLKLDEIQKKLNDQVEGAAWVGIEIKGTKAIIDIAEKVNPPSEAERLPAHIVAKKMGLVKEILVLRGNPVVKEGDMVREGQVLISGEIWPKEEEPKDTEKTQKPKEKAAVKPEFVRAKGTVRARIWYEGYGEAPIIETGRHKTGQTTDSICIKILGKEIILKGPGKSPYKLSASEQKVKRIPKWRNIRIPVELINTKYFELANYRIEHGPDKAEKLATDMALAKINKKIPPKRKILAKKTEQIRTYDDNLVRVKAIVETLEDISAVEIIKDKGDSD